MKMTGIISFKITKLLCLVIILSFLHHQSIGQSNCHIIELGVSVIDGTGNYLPGDSICVQGGEREYLLFRNIHGTVEAPIIIANLDAQVVIKTTHFYGIKFENCSYIKLSGASNTQIQYGFNISWVDLGAGISIDNLSTDVEIENVEIANTAIGGIYAKTEPTCTLESTRENFTMYNIKIHDCYLHDIADEGFYIGSSKYTGQTVKCGDEDIILLPHVIEGVEIYNNIIENTGWDGIQVSSAISDCKIYNNIIRNDSYRETLFQMSGILIGGGSNCDCYNNQIYDGKGDGIDILGLGNHQIFNNLIVRPGKSYHANQSPLSASQKHGIWVGDVVTEANSEMRIYNNTIVSPKTFGLKLTNTSISQYNVINNIIVDPGAYNLLADNSYINKADGINNYLFSNNLLRSQISEIHFYSELNDNYDIQTSSPAVDEGLNLSSYELTFDIENRTRPFRDVYDIGAYENQESINSIKNFISHQVNLLYKVSPNPVSSYSNIRYEIPKPMRVKLYIIDELGRIIKVLVDEYKEAAIHKLVIHNSSLKAGLYYLIMECELGRFNEKIAII